MGTEATAIARTSASPQAAATFADAGLDALIADGKLAEARQRCFARLRERRDAPDRYADLLRLELQHGGEAWQTWIGEGWHTCPELAELVLTTFDEHALTAYAVRKAPSWSALRLQRAPNVALRLLALRLGGLLWQDQLDDALAAIAEQAFVEHSARDPKARALAAAVLTVLAFRDPTRAAQLAPAFGIALTTVADAPPPYPMDVLEHAIYLAEPMANTQARAACPPTLLRAAQLGPLFDGIEAHALLDALRDALRAQPDAFLRHCDAAVELAPVYGAWLADTIAELVYETPERAAAAARASDGAPGHVAAPQATATTSVAATGAATTTALRGVVQGARRRRWLGVCGLSAAVLGTCALALVTQLDVAFALGAPLLIAASQLGRALDKLAYHPRVRPELARTMARLGVGVAAIARALADEPGAQRLAARAEHDRGLQLFGALTARACARNARGT